MPPQKVFENYRAAPTQSPYALLNASTDNGTINPYMAYVRPQQEQQANQSERGANDSGNMSDQPAPSYPPVFQNYGSYYPGR